MAGRENVYEKNTGSQVETGRTDASIRSDRMDARSIVGCEIRNPQGDDLGKVDNIMVNLHTGEVEYAVVEFGAFLGVGGKLFAVPLKELTPDPDKKMFILNRDKEYLKKSPGFDKDHWPDTNDHSYFDNVSMYYGSYLPPFP